MSTEQQARALMMRHRQVIKNRQQSMLNRAASEIGMDIENNEYWSSIQGKVIHDLGQTYDRGNSSLS